MKLFFGALARDFPAWTKFTSGHHLLDKNLCASGDFFRMPRNNIILLELFAFFASIQDTLTSIIMRIENLALLFSYIKMSIRKQEILRIFKNQNTLNLGYNMQK